MKRRNVSFFDAWFALLASPCTLSDSLSSLPSISTSS